MLEALNTDGVFDELEDVFMCSSASTAFVKKEVFYFRSTS